MKFAALNKSVTYLMSGYVCCAVASSMRQCLEVTKDTTPSANEL